MEEESLRPWTGVSRRKRYLWAGLMVVLIAIMASVVLITNPGPTEPAWVLWAAAITAFVPMAAGAIALAINPRRAIRFMFRGRKGP
jgi:hypothetical protein